MKIDFSGEYKSLKTFVSDELNDFTVITGKNGSGKSLDSTHLIIRI